MKKRLIVVIAALVIVTALAVAGTTLSYFTANEEEINRFIPASLQTEILENDFVSDGNVMFYFTNGVAEKEIKIKNVSSSVSYDGVSYDTAVDAYIRVMLVPTFADGASNFSFTVNGNNDLTVTSPNGENIVMHLDSQWRNNWILKDGFFYYKKKIAPGSFTSVLLQNVSLSGNENLKIEVLTDAIQADGNAASDAWGVTLANGEITG